MILSENRYPLFGIMRSMRRWLIGAAVVAASVVAVAAWDFAKLSRSAPPAVPAAERATAIVVDKAARRLTLLRDGQPLRSYAVALGRRPQGHKLQEGDARTPEGAYAIDFKNARSRFHLSVRVSYPNADDRESARRRGVPPGGDIMVHGLPNGLGWLGGLHRAFDWTDGCVAVTNAEMEEIWRLVEIGTTIEIRP
jgi:murein L,D-transpeptidase YafK